MDVFVTGGSGFVGGHLLRALTAAGHTRTELGYRPVITSDDGLAALA